MPEVVMLWKDRGVCNVDDEAGHEASSAGDKSTRLVLALSRDIWILTRAKSCQALSFTQLQLHL